MKIHPHSHIILASHNQGKLVEMQELLAPYQITANSSYNLGLTEPIEDGLTFAENALIKARSAAKESGQIAISDNSGFCVEALDDAPGIYSARWAGEGRDFNIAMQRVHDELGDNPKKSAYFITVLAVVWPDGTEKTYEGRIMGQISWPPRGDKGFGYDPIFIPNGKNETFAEIEREDKQKISHRGQAFQLLIADLLD